MESHVDAAAAATVMRVLLSALHVLLSALHVSAECDGARPTATPAWGMDDVW